MDIDWFQLPKNPVKTQSLHNQSPTIDICNKFQVPDPVSCDNSKADSEQPAHKTQLKLPAIYIYGITNTYNFTRTLAATCAVQPRIHHCKEYILLQFESQADFVKIKTYCLQYNIQFATDVP